MIVLKQEKAVLGRRVALYKSGMITRMNISYFLLIPCFND